MDSTRKSDGSNYSAWCDKKFTHMYSHGDFSPRKPKFSPGPPSSAINTKKTLYASSQERILANTKPRGNGDCREVKLARSSDRASDSGESSSSPEQKIGSPKLKSVVTLVQHAKNLELKKAAFLYDKRFPAETSSPSAFDSGVPKRCFGDDVQEPELTEGKAKKKKHKKHEVASPTRSSVKMKSVCSVVSKKETNGKEERTVEHKFESKLGQDRGHHSEKLDSERQVEERETKESSPRRRKHSAKTSRDRKEQPSEMLIDSSKRTDQKVTSTCVKKGKEKSCSENPDINQNRSPFKLIKDKTGLDPKILMLLHPPPLPDQPHMSEDDGGAARTSIYNRCESESSKEKEKSSTSHQRTDSTSSISSTSTSASNTSSVESVSYTESKTYKKTVKTTKTVISYKTKTAKHQHKSKRSRESYDNVNGSEKAGSRKHGNHSKDEVNGEKARSTKKISVRQRKGPDATLVLSHIKKAFASSCTDSDLEGSPIKATSLTPKIAKSLATNVKECTKALKNLTEKDQDVSVMQSEPDAKTESKEHSEDVKIEAKSTQQIPKAPIEQRFDVLNTTYKFSENKPVSPTPNFDNTTYKLSESNLQERKPLVSQLDNPEETGVKKASASPKQLAPASLFESTEKNESINGGSSDANHSKTEENAKESGVVADNGSDEKMPELEEYNVEPDELGSDSDDDSWSKMVESITKEKDKTSQWDYVVDPERRRLRVEGTTYAAPPVQWRTNWYMHDVRSTLVRPPLPRAPPPLMGLPTAAPSYNLYQKASQKMYKPPTISPFLLTSSWSSPPPSRRQKALQEDTNWTTKKPEDKGDLEEGELEELEGEIYYSDSNDEDGTTYDVSAPLFSPHSQRRQPQTNYPGPLQTSYSGPPQTSYSGPPQTSYSGPSQTSYSGPPSTSYSGPPPTHSRNLPPRLLKLQQQYSRNSSYHSPARSSSWNQSYYQQSERDADSSNVVNTRDNYNSGYSTPRSSWPVRKSLSPGTPFEYDTASIVYPYSMNDYVDTHCHIDFLYQRLGYRGTFEKFASQYHFPPNYAGCVAIFCTPESLHAHSIWKDLLREEKVWGAFGVHPHHIKHYDGRVEENIMHCMKHPKAVAVGEIGLDYSNRNSSDWILQQEVFRRQLDIALKLNKPLVIHSRDAEDDTIDIMASMVPRDYPIHRHCFTGTPEEAR